MKVWKVASKSALMTRQVCQEEERMILKLNFQSEVPIYQQICNQIIYWISTGELKPGEKLPTVRGLAEEAGNQFHDGQQGLSAAEGGGVSCDGTAATV